MCVCYIPLLVHHELPTFELPAAPSPVPWGASLSACSVAVQYFNSKPFSFSAASTMPRCPCGRPRQHNGARGGDRKNRRD